MEQSVTLANNHNAEWGQVRMLTCGEVSSQQPPHVLEEDGSEDGVVMLISVTPNILLYLNIIWRFNPFNVKA